MWLVFSADLLQMEQSLMVDIVAGTCRTDENPTGGQPSLWIHYYSIDIS